jgi:lysophospholipase L1-like esterase
MPKTTHLTAFAVAAGTAAAVIGGAAPTAASSAVPSLSACAGSECSFDVPPGTYEVTVTVGSQSAAADTGLNVEARRTVLAPVATAAGEFKQYSVTVNVRTPESMPDGQEGPGTPGLQVYLTGTAPALASITVTPRPHSPQLFIISDSTAADWLNGPKRGWGQELPQYFRQAMSVANYADSGSSTVSWLSNPALFATVKALIHPGDEVLIQLAHNDKTTPEATYRANLETLIAGVRGRGGKPVLVTPPVRHLFNADGTISPTGRIVNNLGVDLPAVMRQVAAGEQIPLLDLTADSAALLEKLGPAASWPLYVGAASSPADATHFTPYGATVISGLVAGELTAAHLPAAAFLRHAGD